MAKKKLMINLSDDSNWRLLLKFYFSVSERVERHDVERREAIQKHILSHSCAHRYKFHAIGILDRCIASETFFNSFDQDAKNAIIIAKQVFYKNPECANDKLSVADTLQRCNAQIYGFATLYDLIHHLIGKIETTNRRQSLIMQRAFCLSQSALQSATLQIGFSGAQIALACCELAAQATLVCDQLFCDINLDCVTSVVECFKKWPVGTLVDAVCLEQDVKTVHWTSIDQTQYQHETEAASNESMVSISTESHPNSESAYQFFKAQALDDSSENSEHPAVLGYGAYGCVQTKPGDCTIAVKSIMQPLSGTSLRELGVLAFMKQYFEAQMLKKCNIVQFSGVCFDRQPEFPRRYDLMMHLEMEMIYGKPIDQVNRKNFDFKTACKQLVRAVFCLHKNCIVHRDLKPYNVMVRDWKHTAGATEVVLIDFSAAAIVLNDSVYNFEEEHDDTDRKSRLCGTTWYVPPEVLIGRKFFPEHAFKHDAWSLAITMLEILHGANVLVDQLHIKTDDLVDCLAQLLVMLGPCPYNSQNFVSARRKCFAIGLEDFVQHEPQRLEHLLAFAVETLGSDGADFIRSMLQWDIQHRLSVIEAWKKHKF